MNTDNLNPIFAGIFETHVQKNSSIEELIKKINESGLSDSEISNRSGVNRTLIWKIRNKKTDPRISTVTKIIESIQQNKKAST